MHAKASGYHPAIVERCRGTVCQAQRKQIYLLDLTELLLLGTDWAMIRPGGEKATTIPSQTASRREIRWLKPLCSQLS